MVRSLARWMALYRPVRSWRPRTRAIWETGVLAIFASAMAWSWAAIARLIASRVSRMRCSQAGRSLTVIGVLARRPRASALGRKRHPPFHGSFLTDLLLECEAWRRS